MDDTKPCRAALIEAGYPDMFEHSQIGETVFELAALANFEPTRFMAAIAACFGPPTENIAFDA